MATTPLNTLKNWFKTSLKPTQSQFWAWLDSFWHKDEDIPAAKIDGLQELLDSKVDKKDAIAPDQVGPYDPDVDYVYDALLAEYVSFSNPASEDPRFQTEGFYRLKEDAPAGENPETHPAHWVYQGTVLGEIAIEDVVGLREELDWLSENAGGGDPSSRSYSIDFGALSTIAQEINMLGPAVISNVAVNNVSSLLLTWSGGLQQAIVPGLNNIEVAAGDILTWEITRTNTGQLATLGIHLSLNE